MKAAAAAKGEALDLEAAARDSLTEDDVQVEGSFVLNARESVESMPPGPKIWGQSRGAGGPPLRDSETELTIVEQDPNGTGVFDAEGNFMGPRKGGAVAGTGTADLLKKAA